MLNSSDGFDDQAVETLDQQEDSGHLSHSRSTDADDIHFKEAIQRLLRLEMGIIPMEILTSQIEIDAANLLVEHCILVYQTNLLAKSDDWEPDGYIKDMPENMDYDFSSRLARFNITSSLWLETACLPDTWKQRLSPEGIHFLSSISIYRNQFEPRYELSSVASEPDSDMDNEMAQHTQSISQNRLGDQKAMIGESKADLLFDPS